MATKTTERTPLLRRFRPGLPGTLEPAPVDDVVDTAGVVEAAAAPSGPGLAGRTFESLSNRGFRWYFFSMFGWFASMNMQMLVRGYIVFELTGSYAALGLVSLANAIPGLVLSLPGGAIADRVSKKRVVQLGQLSNTVVSAAIAFLMLSDMLVFEHLVACAVIQGSINSLLMPARQSMISEIVDDARLMNAVALNTAAMNTMRLIAPAIGGVLLATFGGGWAYVLMACLYCAGAVFLIPVRLNPQKSSARANSGGWLQGFSDIAAGCRYMAADRTVLMILSINLIIVLFSMPYQMMLPGFASDVLGAGPGRLGLLMTITGAGSLVGSLALASLPARNRGLILLLGSLLMGVSLVFFSISTWYWATAAIMLGVGVGQAARMSLGNVLLQSYTDAAYRGRVMSIYLMEFSLVSLGTFIIGVMSNVIGVQVALGVTSVLLVVLVTGVLVFMPRMRRLP